MNARDDILASVRRSLGTASPPEDDADGRGGSAAWAAGDVALFCERVADYQAVVHRAAEAELPGVVAQAFAQRGAESIVVPEGFPAEWLSQVHQVSLVGDSGLKGEDLDQLGGVVTTSRLGIAETGTIVLDAGPGQGRRLLSLVPDYHLCLVDAESIADDVPAALAALDPRRPLTLISGPSATSDIELSRVEGVHGPRTLEVVVYAK